LSLQNFTNHEKNNVTIGNANTMFGICMVTNKDYNRTGYG